MSNGYSFCIQVIWCFGCSGMYKAIHVPVLVALYHSTDCSVVLPQCTEVDRCTHSCPSAVPTPIDWNALKWFRALGKIAPHVKVANPHPDPLSAGGVSTCTYQLSFSELTLVCALQQNCPLTQSACVFVMCNQIFITVYFLNVCIHSEFSTVQRNCPLTHRACVFVCSMKWNAYYIISECAYYTVPGAREVTKVNVCILIWFRC